MKAVASFWLAGWLAVAALGCGGNSKANNGGKGGAAAGAGGSSAGGRGGTTGAAGRGGSSPAAGTGGGAAAGTTGAAGTSGAAGTTGVAGTSGAAGTTGAAGTSGAAGTGGSGGGAAGSGGASGLACGVPPCGGNLVGNWSIVSTCYDRAWVERQLTVVCSTVTVNSTSVLDSGLITFTETEYSITVTRTNTTSVNWPLTNCFPGSTCADIQAAYQSSADVQSATCTGTTLCTCTVVSTTTTASQQGTYTNSGNTLNLTPSTAAPRTRVYCVQGDTLHLIELETISQMRLVSDQVAQRL